MGTQPNNKSTPLEVGAIHRNGRLQLLVGRYADGTFEITSHSQGSITFNTEECLQLIKELTEMTTTLN